ncbi:MAG TPA: 30S ribosomal protein S20 [Candidatus Saccharimonadales bacterium]|jgi:small subunit ribosomal protein S20|nr:30S ribosomal protein S20 [Candidatus Saccharimonadales bacterium]
MPIIKSAKKRVRVSRKASVRNSKTRRSLRASLKLFAKSPSAKSQSSAQSNLDKAVKKGVIHKNKAARLKRQAAKRAKAAGVKPVKATAKKPVATAKKSAAAKKPAPKKAPAKKK